MKLVSLPLDSIDPDPDQPRTAKTAPELDALVESIRSWGLLSPLRVKRADAAGRHAMISGHRRYAALCAIGATTADCVVVDDLLGEAETLAHQLAENIIRENLSPIEEAKGYRRYIALRGIPASRAADELHTPPARISRALPLLTLPEALQHAVHTGQVSKETAYYVSRLPEGDERDRLVAEALAGALRRDAAARAVKVTKVRSTDAAVRRVVYRLADGRSLTLTGPSIRLDTVIESLEGVLQMARKARAQGWDVSTLAKVLKDRAAHGDSPDPAKPSSV